MMKFLFSFSLSMLFGIPAIAQEYESDTTYNDEGTEVFETYEAEEPTQEATEEYPVTEDYDYESYDSDDEEVTHVTLEPDAVNSTRNYQNEKLAIRKFDKESWKKIVGETDYKEKKRKPKEEEEKKESESFDDVNPVTPWGGPVLKMISYVLIVGIAIFILYLVAKNVSFSSKFKKETTMIDDPEGVVDDIQDLDVQSLLKRALAEGNFRLAVRLYYLEILKKLHETGIISWKKDKTNRDYLAEIFSRDYFYDDLRKLTVAYELVWYGEHSLSKESYQRLITNFEDIHHKFNSTNKS